ncbi:MAG: hypothetical protein QGI49_11555 [SAR202 cluster bacterium]|jgi:hypothetical protein|nr:hypothetical protein [SAR202 cluster bacterium]
MNTFDLMVIGTGSGLDVVFDVVEMGLSVATCSIPTTRWPWTITRCPRLYSSHLRSASVGITEQEVYKTGTNYVVATYDYTDTASLLDLAGFVKVLADSDSR